jgi:predicted GNAT superfamily acetyltransferase
MVKLRALESSDIEAVVAINNSGYPAVPMVESAEIERLVAMSCLALVAENENKELLGFVVAMDPGKEYESENYVFFESRFRNHLYIDRIVLTPQSQGLGIGSAFYDRVFEKARHDGRDHVTCEVNLEPPNPGSLRFHRRWGFVDVDTQPTKGGEVVVQLLQAPLSEEI